MALTHSEILLALRAPESGWLGVLASVLDEACHDPAFDQRQRQLVAQLLHSGAVPHAIASAARQRAAHFENELAEQLMTGTEFAAPVAARPKLTLVDTGAA